MERAVDEALQQCAAAARGPLTAILKFARARAHTLLRSELDMLTPLRARRIPASAYRTAAAVTAMGALPEPLPPVKAFCEGVRALVAAPLTELGPVRAPRPRVRRGCHHPC